MPLVLLTVGLLAQQGTHGLINTVGVIDVVFATIGIVLVVLAAVGKASRPDSKK